MMAEVNRSEVIEDLNRFLSHCEEITDRVCAALSWDKQKLSAGAGELVHCEVDPGHRIPRERLASHSEKCRLRQQGLSQDEISELVPSSMFYYEKATNVYSTVIDKEKLNEILRQHNAGIFTEKPVPACGRLEAAELTPAERLAIHQSVINSAKEAGKPVTEITDDFLVTDFTKKKSTDKEDSESKSRTETLAVERDLKRRRQTYRAKNVHITRKSYTEVIREVIESQTGILNEAAEEKEPKDEKSERMKSQTRRSRSPERRSRSPRSQDRGSRPLSLRRSRSRSQSRKRSASPRDRDSRSARKSKHRRRSRSSSRKKRSKESPSEYDSEDSRGQSRSKKHKHRSKHKKHKSDRS